MVVEELIRPLDPEAPRTMRLPWVVETAPYARRTMVEDPVSYTHLDVYKRQDRRPVAHPRVPADDRPARRADRHGAAGA